MLNAWKHSEGSLALINVTASQALAVLSPSALCSLIGVWHCKVPLHCRSWAAVNTGCQCLKKKVLSYSHAGSMFPNHCRPVSLQRGKSWITTKEQPKFSTSEYTYQVPNMGHCFIVAWVLGQMLSCNVSSFIGLHLWCQDSLVLEKLGLSLFFSPIVMQAFLRCLATECLLNLSNNSIRRT